MHEVVFLSLNQSQVIADTTSYLPVLGCAVTKDKDGPGTVSKLSRMCSESQLPNPMASQGSFILAFLTHACLSVSPPCSPFTGSSPTPIRGALWGPAFCCILQPLPGGGHGLPLVSSPYPTGMESLSGAPSKLLKCPQFSRGRYPNPLLSVLPTHN